MLDLPPHVRTILESDCARTLGEALRAATDADFAALMAVVRQEPAIPADQRQRAVYMLGRMGRPEAVPVIAEALPKLGEGGRIAAADALGRLGGDRAEAEVLKLSADPAPQVRKFAATALRRLGGREAIDRLRTMVHEDREDFVRESARGQLNKVD
jgi:HEAT repeat protein